MFAVLCGMAPSDAGSLRRSNGEQLYKGRSVCTRQHRRRDLEALRRSVPLCGRLRLPALVRAAVHLRAVALDSVLRHRFQLRPYVFSSQMTPAPGIGLDVARIESDSRQVRRLIGVWSSVAPLYYGDFYPLAPYGTEPTA